MELDTLKQAIADVLNVDINEIKASTTFLGDLGADSLDVYQIVMEVEDKLNISLPETDVRNIKTVEEALNLICQCKSE